MQGLWSPSAKTRFPRCNSCLYAAISLARRATTSASKRRINVGDIFTTCYSAMFATAALADAKIKADRRKQWDLAIKEVKAELSTNRLNAEKRFTGQDTEQPSSKEVANPSRYLQDEHLSYDASNGLSISAQQVPFKLSRQSCREIQHLLVGHDGFRWNIMSKAKAALSNSNIKVSHLKVLDSHVHEMIFSHVKGRIQINDNPRMEGHTDFISREPKTRLHLDKMQEMVAKLVVGLLINTRSFWLKTRAKWSADGPSTLKQRRNLLTDHVLSLQGGRTQLPRYLPADWEDIVKERRELNGSILTILRAGPSKDRGFSTIITEVCYNLLVGNAPPCISTYNILITELTRLGRHDLADVVVDSFFRDSRLRPNEQTVCAILDHYIAKGDRIGFRRTVRRMRCIDGEDMRIRVRHRNDMYLPDVKLWAMTTKVIHRDGFIHQKAIRSAKVFMSLVRGALKFKGAREAVTYLQICVKHGHQFSPDMFIKVVIGCLAELDRNAASRLLAVLVFQWRQGIGSSSNLESTDYSRGYLFLLLQFCGIISSRSFYDIQSYHLLCRKIQLCSSLFERWLRHVHLEAISSDIEKLSQRISVLRNTLAESIISGRPYLVTASSLLNQLEYDPKVDGDHCSHSDFRQNAFDYLTTRLEQLSLTLTVIARDIIRTIYKRLDSSQCVEFDRFTLNHPHLGVFAKLNLALDLKLDPGQAARQSQEHGNLSKMEINADDSPDETNLVMATDWVSKLRNQRVVTRI